MREDLLCTLAAVATGVVLYLCFYALVLGDFGVREVRRDPAERNTGVTP